MRNLYVTGVQRCGLPIKLVLRPHRLPGEPVRAYRAFRMYRDQGPHRSGATRQSVGHWTAWSKQWNWVERAGAYDTLVDKSEQKAQCYPTQFSIRYRADARARRLHVAIPGAREPGRQNGDLRDEIQCARHQPGDQDSATQLRDLVVAA